MKTIWSILIFWLPIVFTGCLEDGINPSLTETAYVPNARISYNYPLIQSGDSTVFYRYYRAEEDENISDDEYSEYFLFQVPSNLSQFTYEGDDLKALKVTLKPSCYCGLPLGNTIEGGTINGIKFGDRWEVEVDVEMKYLYSHDEDSTFVSQETLNRTFKGSFIKMAIPSAN